MSRTAEVKQCPSMECQEHSVLTDGDELGQRAACPQRCLHSCRFWGLRPGRLGYVQYGLGSM